MSRNISQLSAYDLDDLLKIIEIKKKNKYPSDDRSTSHISNLTFLSDSELKQRLNRFHSQTKKLDTYFPEYKYPKYEPSRYISNYNYSRHTPNDLLYSNVSKYNFLSDEDLKAILYKKQIKKLYEYEKKPPVASYKLNYYWNIDRLTDTSLDNFIQNRKQANGNTPIFDFINETSNKTTYRTDLKIEKQSNDSNVKKLNTEPTQNKNDRSNLHNKIKNSDKDQLKKIIKNIENNAFKF